MEGQVPPLAGVRELMAMMLSPELLQAKLFAQFPDAVGPLSAPAKDAFTTVAAERLTDIARFLKAEPELAFDFLQDLTATDHPQESKIRVVYHFYSYTHHHMMVLKVELAREAPKVHSLESLWKAANWLEREVFDLFGVHFEGHPDLRRILLPTDWVGTPLRKDYSEAGGYRDITNVRDNPLDQYLLMDRAAKAPQKES